MATSASSPYLLERVFSATFFLGLGLTFKQYYTKNFLVERPPNHTVLVQNRMGKLFTVDEGDYYYPIPYFHKPYVFQTYSKYEIRSKAASRERDVVNMHLMVECRCLDLIKLFEEYHQDVEHGVREKLSDTIRQAIKKMNVRDIKPTQLKEVIRKAIEDKTSSDPTVDMQVQVLRVGVEDKVKYRYLPQILI